MDVVRKILEKFKKPKQYTFVYCPKCNNEMVSNGHFVEDNDGVIKYKCGKCGNTSFWDFAHFPVPCLRTCADCKYVQFDDLGRVRCDKNCAPDIQDKFEYKLVEEKQMGTTFNEVMDILDKWQFMLGQRAGRELWMDKPTEVQNEDLTNFNRDLEKVRSFVVERDICTCNKCKFLKELNTDEKYAECLKTDYIFVPFETDTREHFCAFGERKED